MAYRQYIGSRYVPIFGRKGEDTYEWDNSAPYEPLTVVMHQGNSFTSIQYVPTGIDINNKIYWAETGSYNAQVEQYRQEVLTFNTRITENSNDISAIEEDIDSINDDISSINDDISSINDDITAIKSDNWVTENRISDGAITNDKIADNAITNDKIADNVITNDKISENEITLNKIAEGSSSIGTKMAANYLGTLIYGPGINSHDTLGRMHAGSIASNGTIEVVISSPFNLDTQNRGSVRFISVENNERDILGEKIVTLGHAQSVTWDSNREKFVVVPLYDSSNGTNVLLPELWLYDSTFTNRSIINTATLYPSGASFDHATNKLYVIGTDDKIYEVKPDNSIVYVSDAAVTSQEFGLHVQGFAVRDNIWYRGNTVGNVAYGYIGRDNAIGNADIERYDTQSNYILFGELDGFDFSPDGNLLCLGDYRTASVNSTITQIFEVITPSTNHYIHHLYHPDPILTSCYLDATSKALRQLPNDTNSPVQNPIMFNFIQDLIGANLRINFRSDFITTDNVQLNNFAVLVLDLQGHTFQCATLRFEGAVLCVKGDGASSVFRPDIIQNYNAERSIIHLSNITFSPQRQQPFSGNRTGSILSATGVTNPNSIKYPTEDVGHVIATNGFYIAANSIYLNNTVVPS